MFGENQNKGIKLDGFTPVVVDLENHSVNDLWVHDEHDAVKAGILTRFFETPSPDMELPRPFGVYYTEKRSTYEDMMVAQVDEQKAKKGEESLDTLLSGSHVWEVN